SSPGLKTRASAATVSVNTPPHRKACDTISNTITIESNKGDAMQSVLPRGTAGKYALATGEAADYRLRILHDLYGPRTRRVLLESGLRGGMRVADLGGGVGMVTALLAELVGPWGHVVGVDSSGAQLAQARQRLKIGGAPIRFVEASATDTGLPPGSF